ncbi:AraC family transcriptional regulator [Rheinheimera sp. 1928-s]|uniref:AraC family transcriptional regulator n=1 Tax=Rheinheimera sp. 1928-s TaxID=3033803 RepID=UPI00263854BC|nr:AraC family transcriptional regulator [Rheinheimera sp. 1928-s]MDF3125933.1 AraC family transcriptional regulator [Rheinheimera sp. 1928-s]
MTPSTHPLFWRHSSLPYVELRLVLDGRQVTYAPHSHQQWSVGAILAGQSEFLCADRLHYVEQGALVVMNPDQVHACNPRQGSPWAYYMMHLDKHWLADLLLQTGVRPQDLWCDTQSNTLRETSLFDGFVAMAGYLMSPRHKVDEKEQRLKTYLIGLFLQLDKHNQTTDDLLPTNPLYQVAAYLNEHCNEDRAIDSISAEFGYSAGYLVRSFKRLFHMTPHAYRLNRRVQLGQQALKQGEAISAVAQTTGFSDQSHFQRVFKQRVAATPDQYRRSVSEQDQDAARCK